MIRWIKAHQEYTEFLSAERAIRTAYFYVPVLSAMNELALGITISKKVSNAVHRNRLKRRIKSWCVCNSCILPEGIKMNIIARRGAADLSWQDLSSNLAQIMNELR